MSPPSPSTALLPSRVLGALLGVHAGDSLGATLEFQSWKQIHRYYPTGLRDIIGGGTFGWKAGEATDDTDLTRALLLAYIEREAARAEAKSQSQSQPPTSEATSETTPTTTPQSQNEAAPTPEPSITKLAADKMLTWYTGPWGTRTINTSPRDIGGATHTGLLNYAHSLNPYTSGAGPSRAGNGSLMRCIPTALFTSSRTLRMEESAQLSAITHNDTRCTGACVAYNEIAAALIRGFEVDAAVQEGIVAAEEVEAPTVVAAIERGKGTSIARLAAEGPGKEFPDSTSGFVLQTLTITVAALLDPRSFEDVLVDVVRIGGDTDTNGAVAGGLLGARDGVEAIPERWLSVLQWRGEFEDGVRRMSELQASSS